MSQQQHPDNVSIDDIPVDINTTRSSNVDDETPPPENVGITAVDFVDIDITNTAERALYTEHDINVR